MATKTAPPATRRKGVILRKNWGSRPTIDRIYWHDQSRGTLSVMFAAQFDDPAMPGEVKIEELEALDPDDNYADITTALFRQCKRDEADVFA